MKRPFKVQWIELRGEDATLENALNDHHASFPVWYLISVMRLERNPGEPATYQAVWALAS
jgi:hypothetical protein